MCLSAEGRVGQGVAGRRALSRGKGSSSGKTAESKTAYNDVLGAEVLVATCSCPPRQSLACVLEIINAYPRQ